MNAFINAKPPIDKSGLKSFMAICEFNDSFIPDFVSHIKPLTTLLKKNAAFNRDTACHESFEWVKNQLASPRVSTPFDLSLQCCRTVNASNEGLGAILIQFESKIESTICCAS